VGIHEAIVQGPGYFLGQRLSGHELETLRQMISAQYVDHLQTIAPQLAEEAVRLGIENYHLLQYQFDHGTVWTKQSRILPVEHAAAVKQMGFYRAIAAEYGPVSISDEELNWRLVRPHAPEDIGPVHADGWFWDLGHGSIPAGWDRFKIWIPIFAEVGFNGLSVKPYSHLRRDWKHHTEIRHGIAKPVLDENVEELNMQLLPLGPGEMVLFHDRLLHGGVVNKGTRCRISLELTIFFRADFESLRLRRGARARRKIPS
jgi:hypothetical protein